ncbi:helix-turn-helix transcriptional regulator [Eubacteriales bacterium mix99]
MRRLTDGCSDFFRQIPRAHLIFSRIPVFIQFISTYFLIVLAMFSVLLSVSRRAQQVAVKSYLDQTQRTLEISSVSFERQINNFRTIPFIMNQTEHYQNIRLLEPGGLRIRHYYSLSELQVLFKQQCLLMEIPNISFILFMRNGSVIADHHYYIDATDCFEKFISFEGMNPSQTVRSLYDMGAKGELLPAQQVSIGIGARGFSSYLIYVFRPSSESTIYGMLLAESDILSLFHLQDLPRETNLVIASDEGEILYTNRKEATENNFTVLECNLSSLRAKVVLSIPDSYFNELIEPITSLNVLYAVIAVAIGTVCSVGFALMHVRPVQRLLRISSNRESVRPSNEYQALEQTIRGSITENWQLQKQINENRKIFRTNLLTRLMVQESYTTADEELAMDYLPQLASPCRVFCLELAREDAPDADMVSYRLLEVIRRLMVDNTLLTQVSNTQFVILAKEHEDLISWMSGVAATINKSACLYGGSFRAGASEAFSSLERLHSSYLHALFCMQYVDEKPLSVFYFAEEKKKNGLIQFSDLYRFHNAVLACETDNANHYLDVMMETVQMRIKSNDEDSLWQLTSAVRLILDSICEEAGVSLSTGHHYIKPAAHSFGCISSGLKVHVDEVIQALNLKRDARSLEFSQRVMEYLWANYADASLCIDSVAEYFCVSKSYLYRVMKRATEMTISESLEHIRMEKARGLLRSTQMNVAEIACACGYNSSNTFYKVYKKRFGISPNVDRSAEQKPSPNIGPV